MPSNPTVGRLCDRAGLGRRAADLYPAVRAEADAYLGLLAAHALNSAAHGGRRLITLEDAIAAVVACGRVPMGYRT